MKSAEEFQIRSSSTASVVVLDLICCFSVKEELIFINTNNHGVREGQE